MKKGTICDKCKKRKAEHVHHCFPQTQKNRRQYGSLLDHKLNTQNLCSICHLNGAVDHYTEREFCEILGIRPQSKTEQFKLALGKR